MQDQSVCSCGEPNLGKDAHIIARRHTVDGKGLLFWSDGAVTVTDIAANYLKMGCRSTKTLINAMPQRRELMAWCSIMTYAEVVQKLQNKSA